MKSRVLPEAIALRLMGAILHAFAPRWFFRAPQHPHNWREVMGRRLLASLAATTAVAASLLISSAGTATWPMLRPHRQRSRLPRTRRSARSHLERRPTRDFEGRLQDRDHSARSVGKQVYECKARRLTYEPAAVPVAVLNTPRGATVGIHGQGPFWAHFDGSKVAGLPPLKWCQWPTPRTFRLLLKAESTTGTVARSARSGSSSASTPGVESHRRPATAGHGRRRLLGDLRVLGEVGTSHPVRRRDNPSRRRTAVSTSALPRPIQGTVRITWSIAHSSADE